MSATKGKILPEDLEKGGSNSSKMLDKLPLLKDDESTHSAEIDEENELAI
jgi:hypothetical protein